MLISQSLCVPNYVNFPKFMYSQSWSFPKVYVFPIMLISQSSHAPNVNFPRLITLREVQIYESLLVQLWDLVALLVLILRTNMNVGKELSLCYKLKFSNPYIFTTGWRRSLIFQTYIIWSNRIHSLKYLRFTTVGCKDIRIRKYEFVTKTQFLYPVTY